LTHLNLSGIEHVWVEHHVAESDYYTRTLITSTISMALAQFSLTSFISLNTYLYSSLDFIFYTGFWLWTACHFNAKNVAAPNSYSLTMFFVKQTKLIHYFVIPAAGAPAKKYLRLRNTVFTSSFRIWHMLYHTYADFRMGIRPSMSRKQFFFLNSC
jgi:hypothetical protein